jgi:hypothetical protein
VLEIVVFIVLAIAIYALEVLLGKMRKRRTKRAMQRTEQATKDDPPRTRKDEGLDYINQHYGCAFEMDGRVRYYGGGEDRFGTIKGTSGAHLKVVFDGNEHFSFLHPEWKVENLGLPEEKA